MNNVVRVCRKCSAEILTDAPEGLCTACLFETGLGLLGDDDQDAISEDGSAPLKKMDVDEEIVPPAKRVHRVNKFADFGDYELCEEIGRGGQGIVFRARQRSLNRTVALKVIGLGQWATQAHLKRFRLEAEAAASLEHPGIVPIHEVGEHDGSCYFSMKLVEGGHLDTIIQRGSMPVRQAAELILKVARIVHYAHEHGILHRDIKPGNILLDQQGEPHLTDFGLARLVETESTVTRTLEVLGTPSYMAPEQAVGNNDAVSNATDVYGLGAVLYQLLTGHPPFAGGTTYETIRLLLQTEPRQPRLWNPKIDRDLSTICLKCLEKDPQRRYASALALSQDLQRWLKHQPILARRSGILARGKKWVQRNPTGALLAASLVALASAAGWIVWKSEFIQHPVTTGIAVLPFENLSDDKEHEFFADGVQDDILIKLAKLADLKVISRSSVMQYRGKQNLHEIAEALRVSHVLEGTVRRSAGKVHVNAQLVDTRTDAGIWAEEYDRDLNDVFTIEMEVAQSIAKRLRAKISARESAAMQERPTRDLIAYDLYVRAVPLIELPMVGRAEANSTTQKDLLRATDLLNQAVTRDPAFLLAYCWLARAHDSIYFQGGANHTSERLAAAESAIDSAFRLKPDSGEAHLALAVHLLWGYFDCDRARNELKMAQGSLPNNARVLEFAGLVDRRQGRWSEAVRNFEKASELDPRNPTALTMLSTTYYLLRDYQKTRQTMDRLLALKPDDVDTKLSRAGLALCERADDRPLRAEIQNILAQDPTQTENDTVRRTRMLFAMSDRDFVTAGRIARTFHEKSSSNEDLGYDGRAFWIGVAARLNGDDDAAHAAFVTTRAEQEALMQVWPELATPLSGLAFIDAALGRKEDALREGRQALELTPLAKDALIGPEIISKLALIYAWTGEPNLAIEQLEVAAKIPGGLSYGELRLSPMWDSLRSDPRFEKIVASLAPKEMISK